MTAVAYQRALCDLIASPKFCLELRRRPEVALESYDLTARERRRLEAIVHQPGMSVSCTLYRVNRLTPLATLLPLTCRLLGPQFIEVAERFWTEQTTDLQFRAEIERFRAYLAQELRDGSLDSPYLLEVVDFEIATNRLRFMPRASSDLDERATVTRVHPNIAVVVFRHDPTLLLGALSEERNPPHDLPEGRFPILLDGRSGDLELLPLRRSVESAIKRLRHGKSIDLAAEDELRRAGMLTEQPRLSR